MEDLTPEQVDKPERMNYLLLSSKLFGPNNYVHQQLRSSEQAHVQLDQVAQSPVQPDLECFQGWGIYSLSGQPVPSETTLFWFKTITLVLSQQALLKGLFPSFLEALFKSPRSLLQAEQPQFSQPVFTGEVLQLSDHLRGPPLDPLQQVHAFPVLRTPELDAVLQDTVGFLGCERTLLAHVQFFIHQYPQVLLFKAALNPFIPQPVLIAGVALIQVQHPARGLAELHKIQMGPLLDLVQVPLDGIQSLRRVNRTTQLGVICKFAEGALGPTVSLMKILNSTGPNIEPLTTILWMRPSSQFLVHQTVYPLNPSLSNLDSSCTLAFLTPSLHNQITSLCSSQDTCPCFHCLCISFLPFTLTRSRLIHAGLLPSFPDFLHLGIKSSCALWKTSLKICQLYSAPLSPRAVSQGALLTNSLKSKKFAFLKFRVLTLLFAYPICLRTVNSTA
ncbi:hypothetical protein QYF61_026034 [Mycteria americana]|uniref:Uncharacterized protein n=1 Tax=Mycteria americana TaxID=33587 RepID=A0AAN7NTV0_MYCAM|nr:hypothetical protein QYF61_026034 [Mycteria americana]